MRPDVKKHPYLDITVQSDGWLYLPQSGSHKGHWTKGTPMGIGGYLGVTVKGKKYLVHRLVGETFISNADKFPEIDHIDRCITNNRVENLRWCTRSQNLRNTIKNDWVDARGGTHAYEDRKQYDREKRQRRRKKCVAV